MSAPRQDSRYQFSRGIRNDAGDLYLTPRVPFRYEILPDTGLHQVIEGDTLRNIAARYYNELARLPIRSAAEFYWIIADFQPTPILDPLCKLSPGTILYIPSVNVVVSRILARPSEDIR